MTAAHPLAVLPLRTTSLDWTCLVIGSMAPDFEYFLRLEEAGSFGHTWLGLFLFCLPVTLCAAWLFHRVIKRPLVHVAPFGDRLAVFAERPWRLTWTCVPAALLGAVTHDLWDGITHPDMFGPQHIPWLLGTMHVPVIGSMLRCRVLQYGSTLVGLVVLGFAAWRALARVRPQPRIPPTLAQRLVWVVCMLAAGALCILHLYRADLYDPGSIAVGAIDGVLFGGLAASLITR